LLRVPRPLCGLRLYLRKIRYPIDTVRPRVCANLGKKIRAVGLGWAPKWGQGGARAAGGGHERRRLRQPCCGRV